MDHVTDRAERPSSRLAICHEARTGTRDSPVARARAQARIRRLTSTAIVVAGGATAFIWVTVAKEHPGSAGSQGTRAFTGADDGASVTPGTTASTTTSTTTPATTTTPTTGSSSAVTGDDRRPPTDHDHDHDHDDHPAHDHDDPARRDVRRDVSVAARPIGGLRIASGGRARQ